MVSVLSFATYLVIFVSLVLCESNQPNNGAPKKETSEDINEEWIEGSSFTEVEEIFLDAQLMQLKKENLNLKQSLETQQRQLENTRKINKQLADDKKESMEKNHQVIGELQRDLQSTQATLYVLQPKLMLLQNNLTMTLQNFKNLTIYARNMESMLETELQLKSTHQEEASLERQMHQNTKKTLEDLQTFSKFVMNLTKIQNARIFKLENVTTSMDITMYLMKEKEKAYMSENLAYQNQIVIQETATYKERDQKEKLKIALKQQNQLGKIRERMLRVLNNAMVDMTLSIPNCTSLTTQAQKSQIDAHFKKEDTMKLLISQFILFNSSSTNLQDVYVQMNSQLKGELETKNEIIKQQLKENKELVKSLEERKQLANIQSESLQLLKAEVDLLIPNDLTRTSVRRNLDGTIKSINLCQCIPEAPKASHLELSSIQLTCPNDMRILRNDSEIEQTFSLPCSGSACSMEKSSWPKCEDNLQKAWTPWVYENCSQISIGNETIQCGSGERSRSREVRSSPKDPWSREAVLEPCQPCNISQGDKITILPPALETALESLLEISYPVNPDSKLKYLDEKCNSLIASPGDLLQSGCPKPDKLNDGAWMCSVDGATCHAACSPGFRLPSSDQNSFIECYNKTWTEEPNNFLCEHNPHYNQPGKTSPLKECNRKNLDDSGVAFIKIGASKVPVWCVVPKDGSDVWVTIQRRGQFGNSPHMFTEKKWIDYKNYFGDADKEYWIGLENMSDLTSSGSWALDVEMTNWKNETYTAHYSSFKVMGEDTNYQIGVGGYNRHKSTLGDSLVPNGNGMAFTTSDKDNDKHSCTNCALVSGNRGGWWYGFCSFASLNGINSKTAGEQGLRWCHGKEKDKSMCGYSISYSWAGSLMKIRQQPGK